MDKTANFMTNCIFKVKCNGSKDETKLITGLTGDNVIDSSSL